MSINGCWRVSSQRGPIVPPRADAWKILEGGRQQPQEEKNEEQKDEHLRRGAIGVHLWVSVFVVLERFVPL